MSSTVNQHRTPWIWQLMGAVLATIIGAEGGLLLIKLFGASTKETWIIGGTTLIIGGSIFGSHLVRERRWEHAKFSELNRLEQFVLLMTAIGGMAIAIVLGYLWLKTQYKSSTSRINMLSLETWISLIGIWSVVYFSIAAYLTIRGRHARRRGKIDEFERMVMWRKWFLFVCVMPYYAFAGDITRWPITSLPFHLSPALLRITFFVYGVYSTIVLFIWRRLQKTKDYRSYALIRIACAGSIGALGLFLLVLGKSWGDFWLFQGWSFILLWLVRPTLRDRSQFFLTSSTATMPSAKPSSTMS